MTRRSNACLFIGMVCSLLIGLHSEVTWACSEQAKTALEQALCQIKAKDPSLSLPSLKEFQRNPPRTQLLLLKRPAEKLGIKLPEPEPVTAKVPANEPPAAPSARPPEQPKADQTQALTCRLSGERYVCGADTYRLQRNVPNTGLPRGALQRAELVLPPAPLQGALERRESYLVEAYRAYIEAMLSIGLAEVTLSFTKFHHLYDDAQQRQVDFSKRLQTMFNYLKKDKQSMAAGQRSKNLLPQDTKQCERLSPRLVVCDDVVNNWVYAKN